MKKVLITIVVLCMGMLNTYADSFVVNKVSMNPGDIVDVAIGYSFDTEYPHVGFQFQLELPSGFTTVKDEDGFPEYEKNETSCKKFSITTTTNDGFAALPTTSSATIKGTSGTLLTIQIQADKDVTPGVYTVKLINSMFTVKNAEGKLESVAIPDLDFTIKVPACVGIESVLENKENKQTGESIYNLNGQRVKTATKGLLIKDGKKMIAK